MSENTADKDNIDKPELGLPARLNSHRKPISEWVAILANLTVIVGVVVAVFTYIAQVNDNKASNSERRLDRFHTDKMVEARGILTRLWAGQDLSNLQEGLPRAAIDALVVKTIAKNSVDAESVDESLITITDYLDGVGSCRVTNHCNFEIIDSRLGRYAADFFCIYKRRIELIANTRLLPELGESLSRWIADRDGCIQQKTKVTR